ncbi:hypothetical protein BT67DRAFT_91833 [Trichocladium antarcticum]|uniref:Uncharacterized protein n=1 Tax=Trichocladium antarcticum TaxID=1450529 RepID=A0AAN6UFP7_9PEZI|nr:hypothetical protein BT67DRAFT_91833 [Trichocladium antarcticum]
MRGIPLCLFVEVFILYDFWSIQRRAIHQLTMALYDRSQADAAWLVQDGFQYSTRDVVQQVGSRVQTVPRLHPTVTHDLVGSNQLVHFDGLANTPPPPKTFSAAVDIQTFSKGEGVAHRPIVNRGWISLANTSLTLPHTVSLPCPTTELARELVDGRCSVRWWICLGACVRCNENPACAPCSTTCHIRSVWGYGKRCSIDLLHMRRHKPTLSA